VGLFDVVNGMGGGPANRPRVLAILKTACSDGQGIACYDMAEAYRLGNGVPKDTTQVRDCLSTTAQLYLLEMKREPTY
jgi:hypothetical protein